MKNVALMLAVVAALGFAAGTILAEGDSSTIEAKPLVGKITKAADDKGVLEVTPMKQNEKAEAVKVATDDKTVVMIDEKEAKVADLKEGMIVKVTPAEGTATKIVAMKPKTSNARPKIDGGADGSGPAK